MAQPMEQPMAQHMAQPKPVSVIKITRPRKEEALHTYKEAPTHSPMKKETPPTSGPIKEGEASTHQASQRKSLLPLPPPPPNHSVMSPPQSNYQPPKVHFPDNYESQEVPEQSTSGNQLNLDNTRRTTSGKRKHDYEPDPEPEDDDSVIEVTKDNQVITQSVITQPRRL